MDHSLLNLSLWPVCAQSSRSIRDIHQRHCCFAAPQVHFQNLFIMRYFQDIHWDILRDITNDNSPRNISKLVVHQYHFSEKVNKNCYTYFFFLSHFFLAMTVGFGNRGLHKISLFTLSLTELTFKFRRLQNFTTLLWYCLKHKVKIPKIQKWWNWNVKYWIEGTFYGPKNSKKGTEYVPWNSSRR